MPKKNKIKSLQEFLPALAAAAGRAAPMVAKAVGTAALSKAVDSMGEESKDLDEIVGPSDSKEYDLDEIVGPSDSKEYDLDEIVGPSDGYKPDVSEAYLSMLESQLEDEGSLEEFMGDVVGKGAEMGARIASAPMRIQGKVAKGLGKGFGLTDADAFEEAMGIRDEQNQNQGAGGPERDPLERDQDDPVDHSAEEVDPIEEEMYPASKDYPQDGPHFPRVKEEMYPASKDYPQDGPHFPRVKEGCDEGEEVVEETYPAQGNFPQGIPNFPRVVHLKKGEVRESYMMVPLTQPLTEAAGGQMVQGFINAATKVLGQLEPQDIQQIMQAVMKIGQGIMSAKSSTQGGFGEAKTPKNKLKEAIKKGIILHEKRDTVRYLLKNQIVEQVQARHRCITLLNEGPLSNMWQGVKNAASSFTGGQQQGQGYSPPSPGDMQSRQQDRSKEGQKMVSQGIKQVEKAKGKFNQETLKSAGLISQYHDAVLALVQMAQQSQGVLGQMEQQQLQNQVHQAIGQLQYDLESEKSGIDTFLSSLSQAAPGQSGKTKGQQYTPPAPGSMPSAQELGKQAKSQADKQRAEENPEPSATAKLASSPGIRSGAAGKSGRRSR